MLLKCCRAARGGEGPGAGGGSIPSKFTAAPARAAPEKEHPVAAGSSALPAAPARGRGRRDRRGLSGAQSQHCPKAEAHLSQQLPGLNRLPRRERGVDVGGSHSLSSETGGESWIPPPPPPLGNPRGPVAASSSEIPPKCGRTPPMAGAQLRLLPSPHRVLFPAPLPSLKLLLRAGEGISGSFPAPVSWLPMDKASVVLPALPKICLVQRPLSSADSVDASVNLTKRGML